MKRVSASQGITILATMGVIGINILANALPLNGLTTGEISDRFEIYFVPAGYVFSIWALIYAGLLVYTMYQALPSQRENPVLQKIAPYYWASSLANILWLFSWHYEFFGLTLLWMALILISLVMIYRNLRGREGLINWWVRLPFRIYLGWISVAAIANTAQWLNYIMWGGWGLDPALWAVVLLAVTSLLGILLAWREDDLVYGLVLVWALIGITVSQRHASLVVLAAWLGSAVIVIAILSAVMKKNRPQKTI